MTLDEACVALRALIVDAQNILNQLESKSSASPQPVQLHKRKRRVNPDVVQAPVLLDPSLHAFLVAINIDVPPLTEPISRYDVLKWMCAYVKNEALQVESNRKCFGFDQKLCDLFKRHVVPPVVGQECSFLELGKFVTPLLIRVDGKVRKNA